MFLTLAAAGWEGYESVLRHQVEMGVLVRSRLRAHVWTILNETPLAVVCFADAQRLRTSFQIQELSDAIVKSGKAWISTVLLNGRTHALRACITNCRTESNDVDELVTALNQARIEI